MATPLQSTESAANALGRVHYHHDAMIDLILAVPGISQGEIAKQFGHTQAWVSRIFCSDAFQARLAERKTELLDPTIIASLEERMRGVTMQSLDILAAKLEATQSAEMALQTLGVTTKALGFGARTNTPQVQNNFVVMVPEKSKSVSDWQAAHCPTAAGAAASAALAEATMAPFVESTATRVE
jgi:hypothetical protein